MNGTIYMRISPNGGRYIGQTKHKEEHRWKQHVTEAFGNDQTKTRLPLARAIRKYGGDAFTVKILETGIKTQEELNEREQYWIRELHTQISEKMGGLNVSAGGYGYNLYTNIDFQKLYDEGRAISEIAEITGVNPSTVSAHIISDSRENYRRCRMKALKKNPPKSVSCYDVDTLEKVMTFPTTADASLYFCGKRYAAHVARAIFGPAHSAFGYLWKYDEEPMSALLDRYEKYHNPNTNNRGIAVVNIETEEVFKSALQASKQYNVNRYAIVACCKGEKESAAGYHWRFEGQEQPKYTEKLRRAVLCVETGVIYPSVSEAARQTNTYINSLTACLKGRRETVGGFHWKYANEEHTLPTENKLMKRKPIRCVETGVIYPSVNEACFAAGVDRRTLLTRLRGEVETLNGYHYEYYND